MAVNNFGFQGLSDRDVVGARLKYGSNKLSFKKTGRFVDLLGKLVKEPMVIILFMTSCIYFISGKPGDGIFLAVAIVFVAGISIYQDARSSNALEKLEELSQPESRVIRNSRVLEIKSEELVVGDYLVVDEGRSIPADGVIVQANDFSVDESILTGESFAVVKEMASPDNLIFKGTTVATGQAVVIITAVGNQTRLGKIGRSLESVSEEKTPLELQINNFVKKMVILGSVVFVLVWGINYSHSGNFAASLILAMTLAMSILPEEIPVAFTTFMALGAWRLMQIGVVVKQLKTVETLGSASIICTDKTGTLTENKMTLASVYVAGTDVVNMSRQPFGEAALAVVRIAMWASEPAPFDPMEIALHEAYQAGFAADERPDYKMVHEYPIGGKPPMMTHVFENNRGDRIIAAKGAPEALMAVSKLTAPQIDAVGAAVRALSSQGYRVLGVARASYPDKDFPATQQELCFDFEGLVAFNDPPKKNIGVVINAFYRAGIAVKIITGDHALTTQSIARDIGFKGSEECLDGEALLALSESKLRETAITTNIFSRMFPEAKLKVINALKASRQVVAMTGDGVNDGPALKAAHIGIAMGRKGTEIAKEAASLILLDDDLSKMVDAIAMGRRIYTNLKKAIQYIISIHIPIILTVFIPLALGWVYPNIFSPVHVIFLELIMGPTCSVIYENEPAERDIMVQLPRPYSETFFKSKELIASIIQGLAITAGTLLVYNYAVCRGLDERLTRTMVFTCLISANIWLTMVNRSFNYSLFITLRYKNNLMIVIVLLTATLTAALLLIKPVAAFFEFGPASVEQLSISVAAGFFSVIWMEAVKWIRRKRRRNGTA